MTRDTPNNSKWSSTVVATTPVNFYRVKPSFEVPLVYQNYYPDANQSRDPILLQYEIELDDGSIKRRKVDSTL